MKMHVKTGDNVQVIAGKDKGKSGKVIQVFPKKNRVVVDGVNILKKHLRSQKKGEQGQRIELPAPIHASNVKVVSAEEAKASKAAPKAKAKSTATKTTKAKAPAKAKKTEKTEKKETK